MPDLVPLPVAIPLKRSASVAGLGEKPHRPAKRRAPKACQSCRARKVRCNVTESGPPCTNCRLDEVDCTVTESKRKRRCFPKIEDDEIRAQTNLKGPQAGRCHATNNKTEIISKPSTWPNCKLEMTDQGEHVPHSLYRFHNALISRKDSSSRPPSSIWPRTTFSTLERIATASDASSSASSGHWMLAAPTPQVIPAITLPKYIEAVPSRLGCDEIAFLHKKNALAVPDTPLRDTILQCYIEFVHPFTPILNLKEFLHKIYNNDGSQVGISLLLFQAVMFAGSAHVDEARFIEAGQRSRKEARRILFQRVRLLYDFDYDVEPLSQIQALLLMSSWYDSSDDKKDGWHWMGIAITTAYSVGLNRDPAHASMDLQQQRQHKRIWWSLVILDRLIALALRRPARIMLYECDVPGLALDDFDFADLSSETLGIASDCTLTADITMQRSLAETCVELTKICFCISKVVTAQYSIRNVVNMQETLDTKINKVEECHNDLEDWYNQMADATRLFEPSTQSTMRNDASIVVHRSLLHMVYFATMSALHRPQLLRTNFQTADPNAFETSRLHVDRAAAGTSDIAKCLLDRKFVGFLPTIGITVLSPAVTENTDEIEGGDREERERNVERFGYCVQAMKQLQGVGATDERSMDASSIAEMKQEATRRVLTGLPTVSQTITPPPDTNSADARFQESLDGADMAKLAAFLASTPPDSNASLDADGVVSSPSLGVALEREFESFVNLDEDVEDEVGDGVLAKDAQVEEGEESAAVAKYEQLSDDGLGGLEGLQMYEVEVAA